MKNNTLINAIIPNQTGNQTLYISIEIKSLQVPFKATFVALIKNLNSIIKLDTGAAVTLHPGSILDFQLSLNLYFIVDFKLIRLLCLHRFISFKLA